MKKILILAIIGTLTISVIGCDLNSKLQNTKSNHESETVNNNALIDKKIVLNDATDINIEICAAKVSINTYDGEEIKITGNLSEKSKGIDINKDGNKIGIVEKRYKLIGYIIDNESKIDILVPSKFKGNFTFKQESGTSKIDGIKVKNIDISGGTGELKCEDLRFNKLSLNSGMGKVDLNLKEKCGDINIKGGVGEVNIKMTEVGGNLIYNGGIGNSNITIPDNSPVKFVTEKGIGKYMIDAKTSGEETYTFDLNVGIGSINICN